MFTLFSLSISLNGLCPLPQDEGGAGGGLQLGFVAGVILRERLPAFEKMLWRACRGNVFLRVAEIEDPLEDPLAGDEVLKSVFVIFFQGENVGFFCYIFWSSGSFYNILHGLSRPSRLRRDTGFERGNAALSSLQPLRPYH